MAPKYRAALQFQRENPLVRHVVLRKRQQLEDAGLLARVGVDVHPERGQVSEQRAFDALFEGKALRTSEDFRQAYGEARAFGKALAKRGKGSGFMKNLMEQRICSSVHAGLATARRLLQGDAEHEEHEEQEGDVKVETGEEREVLQRLIARLERLEADPKMKAVVHFLDKEQWRDLGVIIFSQYYDTAKWLADALAARYPKEAVGLYAGAGRQRIGQPLRGVVVLAEDDHAQVTPLLFVEEVNDGLHLRRLEPPVALGGLINVDLQWNLDVPRPVSTLTDQTLPDSFVFLVLGIALQQALGFVAKPAWTLEIYERAAPIRFFMKNRYDLYRVTGQ